MAKHLLILDRDWAMAELIAINAAHMGYQASTLTGAQLQGIGIADVPTHDVLLMGPTIPADHAREIRLAWREAARADVDQPFIIKWCLSAQDAELMGMDWGTEGDRSRIVVLASMAELMTHVQLASPPGTSTRSGHSVKVGEWNLDLRARRLTHAHESLSLPPTEFKVLETLFLHQGQVIGRAEIIEHVWGSNKDIDFRTVDVHVKRLRGNLARMSTPPVIETIRGAGYCLRSPTIDGHQPDIAASTGDLTEHAALRTPDEARPANHV